jgi:methylated-DNA-[protein]-cysteine S-methyltransferase
MTTSTSSTLYSSSLDSPVGPLTVVASELGLRAVLWPDERTGRIPVGPVEIDPDHSVVRATLEQLVEYFDGRRREFDLPLDPVGTDFQRRAWDVLRAIPYGTTISYGVQAERMGDRRAARAVGAANGRNPLSIVVPCHRVVGASGGLTGFAGGTATKAWLLDHERRVLRASELGVAYEQAARDGEASDDDVESWSDVAADGVG